MKTITVCSHESYLPLMQVLKNRRGLLKFGYIVLLLITNSPCWYNWQVLGGLK